MYALMTETSYISRQLDAKSNPVTDEQLLIEYRTNGDRELYAQLVYRYERELFNYLRRYLGNSEMAEDVFQTAFLAVHLKADTFQEGRRFRPWLYSIATHAAIDARRRNKKHTKFSLDTPQDGDGFDMLALANLLESDDPSPEGAALSKERVRLIREAMENLPEAMTTVIQLVYFQGMKYREAAEVLDIPVGTVKSRLNNAIKQLINIWTTSHVD
jgi:RNA polymerase sigma-70 factor (ECF subfamily)